MTERDLPAPVDDDLEVPEDDALEQRTEVAPQPDDDTPGDSLEADPADVAEQSRSVDLDDDEYR
jgi:hypothetical protein